MQPSLYVHHAILSISKNLWMQFLRVLIPCNQALSLLQGTKVPGYLLCLKVAGIQLGPSQTNPTFHRVGCSFVRLCSALLGGQTNTTFRPTFLEFRDPCDVNRKPAFVFKLFLGVRFRNFVKLSMRESSKLDGVVK